MTPTRIASFRQRLTARAPLIGSFVKTPSMMLAEVLSRTPLDAVCLDAEHSPFDRGDIDSNVLAYRAGDMPVLVRIPSAAPEQILNALDCGATGIVVPHVDSVAKAEACARASFYGDKGRGYAGSTRAANYTGNSIAENLNINREQTTVIAQIEDLAALESIDEIAAVEGIHCLFIGMMDLTVALGAASASAPEVTEIAERVCQAATTAGKAIGIFVPSVTDIGFWRERGVSLFLLGSDHGFVKQGAAALANQAREAFNA